MNSPHISDISWQLLQQNNQLLPARALDSHKGDHGHVCVIGGDHGYAGASLMASEAALISGAGLVSCATRPEHISAYISRSPEIMVKGVDSGLELAALFEQLPLGQTTLVVGPGLGRKSFGDLLLQKVLQELESCGTEQTRVSMVLDADGLNILSDKPLITGKAISFGQHNVIITPHPAEAARLLAISTAEVQADRVSAIAALVEKYQCTVILKGQQSLVAGLNSQGEYRCYRCLDGNPGMASGGMGDILSGVSGAILSQFLPLGLTALSAAKLACCVHSHAADEASAKGEIGLLATDLLPYIRRAIQSPLIDEVQR